MNVRQEIPVKSFSIAAYVCRVVSGRGRYLVIRRSTPYLKDTWQMVSGRVEPGETGWEAALREIEEETGLVPDRFYSTDLLEQFYEPAQNCVNLVPVFVGFLDTDREVQLSWEHDAFEWIGVEEAERDLLFDADNNLTDLKPGLASSSDTRLVPNANVKFGGTAAISTVAGRTGTSTVTITVSDGQSSGSVPVTVKAAGNGNDTLLGTSGADFLLGQNGDDTLGGSGASDVLCGANGNDRLSGGSGSGTFDGGSGTDRATDYNATEGDSRIGIP